MRDHPQEGVLRVGFIDSIYGRSKGGLTPSGLRCDHLPYLVELDNWVRQRQTRRGESRRLLDLGIRRNQLVRPPEPAVPQRLASLRVDLGGEHDPAGYLEMPGCRVLATPADGQSWYFANTPSQATPHGFGQEETIRSIWAADR